MSWKLWSSKPAAALPQGLISPKKLAHFVLMTRDMKRLRDWYLTVLHGSVVYEDSMLCFITYDDEHHRIAMALFRECKNAKRASA
jgi:catechol-2,3-dioxygenase